MNRLGRKADETLIEMALSADGEECNGPETISTAGSEIPSSSEGLSSTETTLLIPEHQVCKYLGVLKCFEMHVFKLSDFNVVQD